MAVGSRVYDEVMMQYKICDYNCTDAGLVQPPPVSP